MFSLIKSSFSDIVFIYKNFTHWLVSRVLITLSRYILAFLFVLPFLILFIFIVWLSPYSLLGYEKIMQDILITLYPLGNNFLGFSVWTALMSILLIVMVLGGLVSIFYNRILLAKLNLKYLNRKKLDYKKNLYVDRKMFIKYLGLSAALILILLLPVVLFVIGFMVLFFVFGGSSGITEMMGNSGDLNLFSILSFIYFILCTLIFLYLLYRLIFSYFTLVTSSKKTIKYYILKSFTITKGLNKLLKFIGLMGVLFIAYMPLNYISQVIDFNAKSVSSYIGMTEYIGDSSAQEKLNGEEFYAFEQLRQMYGNISTQELIGKERFMTIMSWTYFVFHFVFLYGIFDMILVGFYKRELLKK